ncbi:putative 37S ribosomal protein S4 [Choanephora cucurbitarum]|uniref:Putative 37S ribosomal protein S4 n=2 Tax=Choanephora cucurbitarum TaxID=101091 RepID=A0A1C7NI21_9FUNG|nr:putative 37S ribosomal protein S4 [Choanephora cucurbitarum]
MRKPIYSLTRKLGRMSWNKYNLYNISQKEMPNMNNKTLFQQKWVAKRETRAYHGDEVTERQFKNKFFDPKLPEVLSSLDPNQAHPPVAVLTFAELERRLDFVVFRSNFCPSVYAARQLCVHGKVLVNGKKMAYPSHKLKDGDVITVDPHAIQFLKGEKGQELDFTPKPYSQPFLFVPEYLEVNYNTCQTVFLRSPVSRPGRSEIPSPFPPDFHSLAYEYYARNK